MYILIRLVIGGMFLIASALIIHRFSFRRKKQVYLIAAIATAALTVLLTQIPLENSFYTFGSAGSAFAYYTGISDAKLIVDGENSSLVVGKKAKTDVVLILPKTGEGWKLATGMKTVLKFQKIVDGAVIYLYQYRNTMNYYVLVVGTEGSSLDIIDANDSVFHSIEKTQIPLDSAAIAYYASIPKFDNQYWIQINGNTFIVAENEP